MPFNRNHNLVSMAFEVNIYYTRYVGISNEKKEMAFIVNKFTARYYQKKRESFIKIRVRQYVIYCRLILISRLRTKATTTQLLGTRKRHWSMNVKRHSSGRRRCSLGFEASTSAKSCLPSLLASLILQRLLVQVVQAQLLNAHGLESNINKR